MQKIALVFEAWKMICIFIFFIHIKCEILSIWKVLHEKKKEKTISTKFADQNQNKSHLRSHSKKKKISLEKSWIASRIFFKEFRLGFELTAYASNVQHCIVYIKCYPFTGCLRFMKLFNIHWCHETPHWPSANWDKMTIIISVSMI